MRLTSTLIAAALLLGAGRVAFGQSSTFGVGRAPNADEIRAWDIIISPTGEQLPPGRGTAREGGRLYSQKCEMCHGPNAQGGDAPSLVAPKGEPMRSRAMQNMDMDAHGGDHPPVVPIVPFATVIWDFINRAMPLGNERTLTPNEIYSLTAYLLFKNNVIKEDDVIDQKTLPQVKMPTRDSYSEPK